MLRYFILLIFCIQSLYCQDVDDLFGELDAEVSKAKTEMAQTSLWQRWNKNSSASISFRNATFFKSPTPREGLDDDQNVSESIIKYESSAKIGNGNLALSGWLEYGTQEHTYRGISNPLQDNHHTRNIFELNELYWIHSLGDFDLIGGKKIYTMGVSTIYSPANQFVPTESNDPLNPKEMGIVQVGMNYYSSSETTWSFFLFPLFTNIKAPGETSRWSGTKDENSEESNGTNDVQAFGFETSSDTTIDQDLPANTIKNIQALLQYKTIFNGFDIFTSLSKSFTPGPVLKEISDIKYVKETIPAAKASAGFSTTWKNYEFHSEIIYQFYAQKKDDLFFDYVAGMTLNYDGWTSAFGLDKIEVVLEYAGEKVTERLNRKDYARSSLDSRQAQNNMLSRFVFTINDNFRAYAGASLDLDKGGSIYVAGAEYKWGGRWSLNGSSEFIDGSENSYYGQWKENDRFVLNLKYTL